MAGPMLCEHRCTHRGARSSYTFGTWDDTKRRVVSMARPGQKSHNMDQRPTIIKSDVDHVHIVRCGPDLRNFPASRHFPAIPSRCCACDRCELWGYWRNCFKKVTGGIPSVSVRKTSRRHCHNDTPQRRGVIRGRNSQTWHPRHMCSGSCRQHDPCWHCWHRR